MTTQLQSIIIIIILLLLLLLYTGKRTVSQKYRVLNLKVGRIYEGKSLNKRNFILKCIEKYAKEKSCFGTQNGSLAVRHIRVVTIKQFEPAQ